MVTKRDAARQELRKDLRAKLPPDKAKALSAEHKKVARVAKRDDMRRARAAGK